MKHTFFFKLLISIVFSSFVSLGYSADIYLSNLGIDTNTGVLGSPVKTLSRAISIANANDVIHVMSFIDMTAEPTQAVTRTTINLNGSSTYTWNTVTYNTYNPTTASGTAPVGVIILSKALTIIGDDKSTCGFDGKNSTPLIRQDGSSGTVNYQNLTFKNGKSFDTSGGGGIYIRSTTANFTNCEFTGNASGGTSNANPGGAVTIITATSTFTNTRFSANIAKSGSGIYAQSGTITLDGCTIENNDASALTSSVGAGIYVYLNSSSNLNFNIKNTVFKNNKTSGSGAAFNYLDNVAYASTIKFTNCAFITNTVTGAVNGGAVYIDNKTASSTIDISFINSTFYDNLVGGTSGGAILANSALTGSKINIINCTITGNKVTGGNGNAGAGIRMLTATLNSTRKILNCIIENNVGNTDPLTDISNYADFVVQGTNYTAGSTLVIDKSFIGRSTNTNFSTDFGTNNNVNYATASSGNVSNSFRAKFGLFNSTYNYFPLQSNSPAIDYGLSTHLSSLNPSVTTDQLGNTRTFSAGLCTAGAIETSTTPSAPTVLVATAGDGQISLAFTAGARGGTSITNYKYSTDGTNFVACSPAKTTSPIVITGLTNGNAYTIKLKAVNANGDGTASVISNEVTPHATANDIVVSTPTNISTLALTPVSDVVVSGDVLTINQATTVNSLTVAPGAKVTVTGTNALTATNGITLESDANGTATLIDSYATPTISATVKQHVSAGRNWYVSAPVSASGVGALSRGNSVVEWNEATKAWDTKTSGNLLAGKGYIQVSNALQGTTGTVDFSGLTNSGDVTVSVSRTESGTSRGFNLVGNPYPSYIDWNGVIADSENALAGISSSFWFRTKNTLGAYVFTTYNGTSSEVVGGTTANTTINNLIPPMQAFWIKVNPNIGVTTHSTTLKFKNTMREHGLGDNNKLKAPKLNERIRLRLQLENGTSSDETLIYFDKNASDNFDAYDSPKMFNNSTSVPDLYSKSTTESLVINGLSELRDNMELPLGFGLNAAATLRLKATELTNFPIGTHIYLIDKGTQTQQELVVGEPYTFNTSGSTVNNESRFSIIVRAPKVTTSIEQNSDSKIIANVNANGQIVLLAAVKSNYAIYNALGIMLESGVTTSNAQTLNFKLQTGVYFVKVNNVSNRVILK